MIRMTRTLRLSLALTLFSVWPLSATGAKVEALKWEDDGESPALMIRVSGETSFVKTILEGGRRLRVTIRDTMLDGNAVDIPGRGVVKGVFPYIADNGHDVNVDLLLRESGSMEIQQADFGYRVVTAAVSASTSAADVVAARADEDETVASPSAGMTGGAATPAPTGAVGESGSATAMATGEPAGSPSQQPQPSGLIQLAQADQGNVLQEVVFSALPGGRVQIDLRMTGEPAQPGSFSTNRPPRIAFDFFDLKSALAENVIKVGVGAVESIVAVESEDRTRVVLNLLRPVSYETQVRADGITLVVASPSVDTTTATAAKSRYFAPQAERPPTHSVARVDFRRSPEGAGRIIVDLSDPAVAIDIREQAGEILVDFLDTQLPPELERRLDVIDFATPVQTVDAFTQGQNVRMVVSPMGNYVQSSYQAGNVFTLTVTPVVEGEEEERKVDEFGYSGERLSLNFQRISVRAALQVIADFTGLNFVTSDSVKGDLTLRLQDVPWDQALDIILQTRGLAMRQKGNVVWVAPAAEITALERQQLEASKEVRELEPLVSELIQVNYAKADDIANLLRSVKAVDTGIQQSLFGSVSVGQIETETNSLLSPRGNVTVDKRTNTILIQDTVSKIAEVRRLVSLLDKPVRQVMIETRIVLASDRFSREIGARLGFNRITLDAKAPGTDAIIGNSIISGSIEGTSAITGIGDVGDVNLGDGLQVDLPSSGVEGANPAAYALRIAKLGEGFAHLIDLELSALEAEGKGKIVSSPRLITNNQVAARIEQGQERIFTTNVLGVGSVVTKKAVLGMEVTPQITPDDRIVLDVFITKDDFEGATDPTINTKQIETQVLLDNGETVVIGGIFEESDDNEVVKVPVLGDIPVLGVMFRKTTVLRNRSELLFFLTPRIISPALNIR